VLERLTPAIGGREVRVDVAGISLVPLDDVLMGQVLANLIENVVHHTPAGTPFEISAAPEGRFVRVDVADRGPGFPPGSEQTVFDKFVRGSGAGSRGVGLGLAICRGLVEAHGGRIEASNRPGGGAVVRFWLPLEGEPPVVEPEPHALPGEAQAP